MSPDRVRDYHQILDRVERDHWWFASLRELVVGTVTAKVAPPSRVLDVGCSTGHVISAVPDQYDRIGADISSGAIELARSVRPEIRFVEAPIEKLPFEDGSFDCVLALDVLSAQGVDDDRRALHEIRRVLRPGGVLLIQVAAYEWLRSGYDDSAGTARRYTAQSVQDLLRNEAFAIRHLTYRITALFPIAAARRLLVGNRSANDLRVPNPTLNRLLAGATRLENRVARRFRLPFGLSIFAVAALEASVDEQGSQVHLGNS
jgi:ubiquinone/menaquinone biosynthesis C-methylase UbiE